MFQTMLTEISADVDAYLPEMFRAMWGPDADPALLMQGRAQRQAAAQVPA